MRRMQLVIAAAIVLLGSATIAEEAARILSDSAVINDGRGSSRILFHWSPSVDAERFVVSRAVLRFDVSGAAETRSLRLSLHPVTSQWDAASVSWNSGWRTPGGDFDSEIESRAEVDLSRGASSTAWDVTSLVKEVLEGGQTFHGLLVTSSGSEDGGGIRTEDAARLSNLANATIELTYRRAPPIPREIAAQDSAIVR